MYGATADSYETVTRSRGGFDRFREGLDMARDAGLNIELSLIMVQANAHEVEAMRAWANQLGLRYKEYSNVSPTIHGGAEPLPQQSPEYLTHRQPFTGCPAGVTFFHSDPFGRASICKVGREPNIDLISESVEGDHSTWQPPKRMAGRQRFRISNVEPDPQPPRPHFPDHRASIHKLPSGDVTCLIQ